MKVNIPTIQIKALLLLMIFTGNFFVVCHCSAGPVAMGAMAGASAMHRSCCCKGKKENSCPDKSGCPGTQAVKFNLLEKQVAAAVHMVTPAAIVVTPKFFVPVAAGPLVRQAFSSVDFYKHSPPDLQALYHCYLI